MDQVIFSRLVLAWMLLAAVIFGFLFFYSAPYGRHHRGGWGMAIRNKFAWIIMESPSPCIFFCCFLTGSQSHNWAGAAFLLMWCGHYIHRAFIYPFSLKGSAKTMPVSVVAMGIFFNAVNAWTNGYYIFSIADGYSLRWLADPRFIVGAILFGCGFFINRQADFQLRKLRGPGKSAYAVAETGLFRLISCPNYLGEILIWTGWAVAVWSLPGLSFALWTAANLVPRARMHHQWYRRHFARYPENRKALIPWVW